MCFAIGFLPGFDGFGVDDLQQGLPAIAEFVAAAARVTRPSQRTTLPALLTGHGFVFTDGSLWKTWSR